jgi:hypothetical protein
VIKLCAYGEDKHMKCAAPSKLLAAFLAALAKALLVLVTPIYAQDTSKDEPPNAPQEAGVVVSGKYTQAGLVVGEPIESKHAEENLRKTVVVDTDGSNPIRIGLLTVDREKRTITLPATLNMRSGVIEYVMVHETGKTHESLLKTAVSARDLHLALLVLGTEPVAMSAHAGIAIRLSWQTNGPLKTVALEQVMSVAPQPEEDGVELSTGGWIFNGSQFTNRGYQAELEGSHISLMADPAATLNIYASTREPETTYRPRAEVLPPLNMPITMTLQLIEVAP